MTQENDLVADTQQPPEKLAGWDEQSKLYREIWLKATPAQRLRKLQEMIEFARKAAASRTPPR
jgi:hypothetical protein